MRLKDLTLRTRILALVGFIAVIAVIPLALYFIFTLSGVFQVGDMAKIDQALTLASRQDSTAPALAREALPLARQTQFFRDRLMGDVIKVSVFYAVAVFLIAMGLGWLFVKRLVKPLSLLMEGIGRIDRGDKQVKVPVVTGGEIGKVTETFNVMSSHLDEYARKLKAAERSATWQRIARTVAHEIKNPLTPIQLSTERMLDRAQRQTADLADVVKASAPSVLKEIGQLTRLVENFHRYAKFPDPNPQPVNICQLVKECVELHRSKFPINLLSECREIIRNVDEGQLRQVINNLLKNAGEALGEKGQVEVSVIPEMDNSLIIIKDNGKGIAAEDMERLFQPYYTTKKEGSGIGLALAERIIRQHGGDIWCESTVGVGTWFYVRI